MHLNKKRIFFWLKIVIVVYCGGGIALYYLQNTFLFHPKKLAGDHIFNFKIPFQEISIPMNKTDTVNIIKFYSVDSVSKGLVIYFHGNMQNVEYYERFASTFTKRGYEVWMPDYPGYGKSTGERTEKKLYDQAYEILKLAMTKIHSDSITVYGKSLGTGIAAYASSVLPCKQLILETPYYSITDLFAHYAFMYPVSAMGEYKIPTWEFLEDVKAPVTVFHGTKDIIIPYSCAEKLKRVLKKQDNFFTIPDAKHNDIASFKIYEQVMDSIFH